MVFTGIVETLGRVSKIEEVDETWGGGNGLSVTIEDAATVLSDVHIGDSIVVSGICLTVTEFDEAKTVFKVGIAPETVRRTNLGDWKVGTIVNLERAMNAGTRFGGHLVQGHVDCTIELIEKRDDPPNSLILTFRVPTTYPDALDPLIFVVAKGYVCLNGASLTVIAVDKVARTFSIMLIAHSQGHTNLPLHEIGARINLEVDEIGKYIESVVRGFAEQESAGSGSIGGGVFASLIERAVDAAVERKLKERGL
ncbi:Riboflavin synthase alpha chain [Physocladia obscura]|uniref:Riboflavin synthase n=1 Tax=Physocladia obscura TaxID=109957 RepID=A0AAD5T3G0_9FUNG|nr:Riboflavin synthase alpha chain [Physocladia obscura]